MPLRVLSFRMLNSLAERISHRTSLPLSEVREHLEKLPKAVIKFIDSDGVGLALSLWVTLQIADGECETYWMHGYPKTDGSPPQ